MNLVHKRKTVFCPRMAAGLQKRFQPGMLTSCMFLTAKGLQIDLNLKSCARGRFLLHRAVKFLELKGFLDSSSISSHSQTAHLCLLFDFSVSCLDRKRNQEGKNKKKRWGRVVTRRDRN